MAMDAGYVADVVKNLYRFRNDEQKHVGTDVLALDILRSRDHGLNGYVKYLELCTKDHSITDWADLQRYIGAEVRTKLILVSFNSSHSHNSISKYVDTKFSFSFCFFFSEKLSKHDTIQQYRMIIETRLSHMKHVIANGSCNSVRRNRSLCKIRRLFFYWTVRTYCCIKFPCLLAT